MIMHHKHSLLLVLQASWEMSEFRNGIINYCHDYFNLWFISPIEHELSNANSYWVLFLALKPAHKHSLFSSLLHINVNKHLQDNKALLSEKII